MNDGNAEPSVPLFGGLDRLCPADGDARADRARVSSFMFLGMLIGVIACPAVESVKFRFGQPVADTRPFEAMDAVVGSYLHSEGYQEPDQLKAALWGLFIGVACVPLFLVLGRDSSHVRLLLGVVVGSVSGAVAACIGAVSYGHTHFKHGIDNHGHPIDAELIASWAQISSRQLVHPYVDPALLALAGGLLGVVLAFLIMQAKRLVSGERYK